MYLQPCAELHKQAVRHHAPYSIVYGGNNGHMVVVREPRVIPTCLHVTCIGVGCKKMGLGTPQ